MLVSMNALLAAARSGGYAVGSFDVNNLEQAVGILDAAAERRSPVMLAAIDWGEDAVMPLETLFSLVARVAETAPVPAAVILDHGRSLEVVARAIRAGATAVMLDASSRPFEENVAITRQAAELAHWSGVPIEAEIGHVASGADYARIDLDRDRLFTRPDEAVEFVERTGVDALAVAVGTAHGDYVGRPRLDFALLAELRARVPVPLVLHGGSSSGDENLRRAAASGVAKVNIYTDMATAARERMRDLLAREAPPAPLGQVLREGQRAFREVAGRYMDIFGSTGRGAIDGV